jgi:thiol-disulfide isomerase/thioredoxin
MYNRAKFHGNQNIIPQTYDYLKTKFTGSIGDFIIASYLLDRPKGDTGDFKTALLNSIIVVKDKFLNTKLRELYTALDYNTATKPHVFEDIEGKRRSLSEWKGKVILIDFWFNGCVHCKHFSKVFEEKILPVFKDNHDVIFIGMNTDKEKKKWIDGIKSKEYTSDSTVNLSTLGQGFSHPFPKMFNIVGAPVLFLIGKDGSLIEANLATDHQLLIRQIKSALSK